jgi:hypothetical protein
MVLSHAGALAFITCGVPASRRALFLLAKRLDYVNLAILL